MIPMIGMLMYAAFCSWAGDPMRQHHGLCCLCIRTCALRSVELGTSLVKRLDVPGIAWIRMVKSCCKPTDLQKMKTSKAARWERRNARIEEQLLSRCGQKHTEVSKKREKDDPQKLGEPMP